MDLFSKNSTTPRVPSRTLGGKLYIRKVFLPNDTGRNAVNDTASLGGWYCACDMVGNLLTYPLTVFADVSPSIEHALSCARGGFPTIRHSEIRNITADLMRQVCHRVGLQPVTGEQLQHRTANREDGARLDVVARNFWGQDGQRAFFDVRVFNPYAPCSHKLNVTGRTS